MVFLHMVSSRTAETCLFVQLLLIKLCPDAGLRPQIKMCQNGAEVQSGGGPAGGSQPAAGPPLRSHGELKATRLKHNQVFGAFVFPAVELQERLRGSSGFLLNTCPPPPSKDHFCTRYEHMKDGSSSVT